MLKVEDLSLKRDGKAILRKISFTMNAGEIYGVLGPNGAGKSTLAYILMGCDGYKPDEGKIIFKEQDITDLPIWQRARLGITLAWQEEARFEGITVEDYLLLGMKEKDPTEVEEALRRVFLEPKEYLKRKVDRNLSGGERKRIELAAIFAMKPRLAILDEPDSGIDILTLDGIIEFIRSLKEGGTAVLLITHRPEVARVAERATLMCGQGCLLTEGTSEEVIEYFKNECLQCPKFR
ncbi:MAG: ATP-binding cassette domain-containing protein [Anaerolineae bacterium]